MTTGWVVVMPTFGVESRRETSSAHSPLCQSSPRGGRGCLHSRPRSVRQRLLGFATRGGLLVTGNTLGLSGNQNQSCTAPRLGGLLGCNEDCDERNQQGTFGAIRTFTTLQGGTEENGSCSDWPAGTTGSFNQNASSTSPPTRTFFTPSLSGAGRFKGLAPIAAAAAA